MLIKRKIILLFFLIFFLSTEPFSANGCGIALHSWKLKAYFKIPVNAPVVPLYEMSAILNKYPEKVTNHIVWLTKYGFFTPLTRSFLKLIGGWPSEVDWDNVFDTNTVVKISKSFKNTDEMPIIVSSDKNYIKLALFVDENSRNNCYQVVVEQDSRVRCVFSNPDFPWAQEFNAKSWLSLIFYRIPLPGYLMAVNVYPVESNQLSLYEDSDLVTYLCEHDCLTKRPEYMNNPEEETFPVLPE